MSQLSSIEEKFALLLVDYCIGVKRLSEIQVSGTINAMPLINELFKKIVDRGGYPRIVITNEELSEYFYRYASKELLEYVSPIDKYVMENINGLIRILAPSHSKHLIGVDPERIKIATLAGKVISDIMLKRDAMGTLKWTITVYPTNAMAQEAGFSPIEWKNFVYSALKLYSSDPIEEWKKQALMQEKITKLLNKVDELLVLSDDTELFMKFAGRTWISDDGKNNMPGGEVFSAPIEDSIEGYITFTYPAIWKGVEVENVKLKFKSGTIIEANASKGEDFLKKMISTDEGSKRVGEFAFGLNYDITRFTKEILFDEKIGGTIHMALGAAYLQTGGKNTSSIHWDIVKDMRKGIIKADKEKIYENGRFIESVI
ncbi:aminopeptidase [Fervidicoccus fontis]|uniref:Peptidase M29, aminopeptidase II n=1 Tax=Fervidicoccus fontis (strain DSM 19380 / JCM 18336 / VKM B-2539 / Kam940) TaxID=1163730 RepID=I0A1C0_FERFK|nr:aminopeptidase [Fervidicoccus fontis]AFH42777.1 peptidase M29, aminopeptidase II [Fervidicoccus fontis Kam940]